MISLDVKSESSSVSPLNLSTTQDEPKLSFSELLKGVGSKKDAKTIQNGALILSLENSQSKKIVNDKNNTKIDSLTNKDSLNILLKGEDKVSKEPLELNPKLTSSMSVKEIKTLILDAKEYLKSKIIQSDGYKMAEVKDLPKTLKGLAELAKKFGVDLSKITIEEVQVKKVSVEPKQLLVDKEPTKELVKDSLNLKHGDLAKNISQDNSAKSTNILKNEIKPEIKISQNQTTKEDVKAEVTTKSIQATKEEVKTEIPVKSTQPIKTSKEEIKTEVSTKHITDTVDKNMQIKDKLVESKNMDVKSTPLFKANVNTEHTTQQIITTKQFKAEVKTPKERADDTLKQLLRGEKPSTINNSSLATESSVKTLKVIPPNMTSDMTKSLETLLHVEQSESTSVSKTDGMMIHKTDSFEVKLNEAKQMIKYLSADVKTAIEDYKPPFTRIKIQLNPQKLGEVDLTIVQRGKNLHLNISSNSVAINTLSTNANELRVQLNNSGINNATLNFSNSSQNSDSNTPQQQHNRQNEREAANEYNYFENEEANEEILSSLEIVVPRYV